jgi:hypothetical protein
MSRLAGILAIPSLPSGVYVPTLQSLLERMERKEGKDRKERKERREDLPNARLSDG